MRRVVAGPQASAPIRLDGTMQVSARVDYGMRALAELAASWNGEPGRLVKGDALAEAQDVPGKFLEGILNQLRRNGIVVSQRGAEGGYRLARDPATITVVRTTRGRAR